MTPRLSGQNCKFFKLLLSPNCQKRLRYKENNTKYRSLTWKPRRHVRINIYRTWPNDNLNFPNLRSERLCDYLLQRRFYQAICSVIAAWGSSSNHDDDGNKTPQICIFDNEKQYFARFARAFFMFWHFEDVLVLSTTWNDLFCSCVDDVSIWWQMFNFVLCPKRWFQFNSRNDRTHFSRIMTLSS